MSEQADADGHDCRTGYHDNPSYGCYTNHGCRCDGCTQAQCDYTWERRQQRRTGGVEPPAHGTDNGYTNYGCRCEECTAAAVESRRVWREENV